MSKRWNLFLCLNHFITYTTMTSGGMSTLRTSWGYCLIFYFCMTSCLNSFGSCLATYCTDIGLDSCLCTTWLYCYLAIIPCMSKRRNLFLLLKHFITYTAMTSGGKTALRTGWRYCLIFYFCVASCFNSFGFCLITYCTDICFDSCRCTTWCCRYLAIIPCMSKRGNLFLLLKHFITYTTMASDSKAALRTSWGYCFIFYLCMTRCFNSFVSCLITYRTGIGFNSCFCTTWLCCYLPIVQYMSKCWNFLLCLKYFITYTAMTSGSKAALRTGWVYRLIFYFCMTGCRNFFLFYKHFPTFITMASGSQSSSYTGWIYHLIHYLHMPCRRNLFPRFY